MSDNLSCSTDGKISNRMVMVILIGIEIEIEIEVKWAEVSVVMYISIYIVSCKRRMQPLLHAFTTCSY